LGSTLAHLVALMSAGAGFVNGQLIERQEDQQAVETSVAAS
jgi:hypothetical protein